MSTLRGRLLLVRRLDTFYLYSSLILCHRTATGLRAAQVHVIFALPRRLQTKDLPTHFAYIEWFTPFRAPDPIHGLRSLSRSTRRGQPNSEIIPLGQIVRSCHLAPYFGRKVDPHWRGDVMSRCRNFLYNHWINICTFTTVYERPNT